MATTTGEFKAFSCRDAIHHLCKRSRQKTSYVEKELDYVLNQGLLEVLKSHIYVVFELIKLCKVPICIIGRKQNTDRTRYACLLDVTKLDNSFPRQAKVPPLYWILDMETGVFLKETTKMQKIPILNYYNRKYSGLKASLWDILQLSNMDNVPEPQNAFELKQTLEKYNLLSQTNVYYCISLVPQQEMPWVMGHFDSLVAPLCFLAYTKPDLTVGYAFRQPKNISHHSLPIFEEKREFEDCPEPDANTSNRRVSVNVKMTSLLLAYKLGLCHYQDMIDMSNALSQCVGAIWVTFDEERHIRHALYKDYCTEKMIELKCSNNCEWNVKAWSDFFKFIQTRAQKIKENKEAILSLLLEKLKPFASVTVRSLWSQCIGHLKSVINKFKVFVFCHDDTVLHHLKVPIAGVFRSPKSKGVFVHTLANHTITALTTSTVVFINLAEYFNYNGKTFQPYCDDDVLWKVAQNWLSHRGEDSLTSWWNPELKHKISSIKNQPKIFGETCYAYVKTRSQRNALAILDLWYALTHFMVTHFSYDLAAQSHQSLSKMSFDIVWLSYAEEAGPFAHALENLHPHSVFKLRPWCKGGFSYSFEGYLKKGLPMQEEKEEAKSIRELDISSAYGYSGMSMSTAKGFGIAFGENVKIQKRHRSFEYRATMYTIFKISILEGKSIRSVFSNYSPLGLVYIGKHAIDLVVVLQDNTFRLIQFDGHFCHGDYTRPHCPSLSRYANDKTRAQCEQQTIERDETILNWLMSVNNPNSTYEVITDCCHSEYSNANLAKAFNLYHPLKDMVQGLDKLDGTIQCVDFSQITFLAIVTGHITKNHHHLEFGPIFVTGDEANQPTITGGKLLLTSNYYQYLTQYFGFQITSIEWIIYYKLCDDLPKVFKKLVSMRNEVLKGSSKDALLKTIVNYACGYFGLNHSKQAKMTARIAYKLPKRFNIYKDDVTPLDPFGMQPLLLIQSYSRTKQNQYLCKTPLVLFIQIIEYGKLRLNKVIQCLQWHLRPTAMHILYSNVDNIIVALSEDNFFAALKDSTYDGKISFSLEWNTFFGKGPGMLKQEWCHSADEDWKFVSPCRMFHVVLTKQEEESHHKSTFFTGLPSLEAFKIAMAVLKKQNIQVVQEKKKDKLASTDTHLVTYNF